MMIKFIQSGLVILSLLLCSTENAISREVDVVSKKDYNKSAGQLHRLDFRLQGKSCPSCLLAIQYKIKSLPGVQNAVVMLKSPFGASVIYQSGQITSNQILITVKEKEPKIEIEEITDAQIGSMPLPLIPPFVSKTPSTSSTAAQP